VVLLLAILIPYWPRVLAPDQREVFAESYPIILILATIAIFQFRLRCLDSRRERVFWNLWSLAYAIWLIPSVWDQFIEYADYQDVAVNLIQDVLYLGFYVPIILALEINAHRYSGFGARGWLRRFRAVGGVVFAFSLLVYLVLIPAATQPEGYVSQLPSFAFYVLLDGYVVSRLAALRKSASDRRWRLVYSWLLATALFWMVGDVVNLFMWIDFVPWVASGTPLDFLWLPQYLTVWAAARLRDPMYGQEVLPSAVEEGKDRSGFPGGELLGYTLGFLVLHFALSIFGHASLTIKLIRDACAFGVLLVMTGLVLVRQRFLEADAQKLEEERARAAIAEHRAYHDALTGLPNRYLLLDRLERAVMRARRAKTQVAVLFLDLDRFKVINDSLGHTAGDQLLRAVGRQIDGVVRKTDSVARVGGDEFMILCPGIRSGDDLARIAIKVLDCLRGPHVLEGREVFISASVGISLYPTDGEDPETLVKNADAALHRAKALGGDRHQLYHTELNRRAMERLQLETSLRLAASRNEFVLHYQPIVDLSENVLHGCEALLRWQHPELGLLTPEAFLETAEITGVLSQVNPWLFETACHEARRLESLVGRPIAMAVNVSARQFSEPGLVEMVQRALEATGLDSRLLEIEITESLAMQKAGVTVEALSQLKELGVKISIDDFGTGYSSLSYLPRFPIDTLKIDRSFVSEVEHSGDAAIIASVVALARALGLATVAEGVETDEQLAAVSEEGCDRAQGYLFSRPVSREELQEWIQRAVAAQG
jgi:diguanylate cyclase (GGDEF)-like protein